MAHYILFIDDSGSRKPDEVNTSAKIEGMDYFALGGVLVEESDVDTVVSKWSDFRIRWSIDYPLHSTEIRGKRGSFGWLNESAKTCECFLDELERFLISVPVLGFATVIDRAGYNARYKPLYGERRWWLCKTAYPILVERVAKYVGARGGTFDVVFEQMGKAEDRALIEYARVMKKEGHSFDAANSARYGALSADDFKRIVKGDPRRKTKAHAILQIADLYLYPMARSGYDSHYRPWLVLFAEKKVIDAVIPENMRCAEGIKYSCFDKKTLENNNPELPRD